MVPRHHTPYGLDLHIFTDFACWERVLTRRSAVLGPDRWRAMRVLLSQQPFCRGGQTRPSAHLPASRRGAPAGADHDHVGCEGGRRSICVGGLSGAGAAREVARLCALCDLCARGALSQTEAGSAKASAAFAVGLGRWCAACVDRAQLEQWRAVRAQRSGFTAPALSQHAIRAHAQREKARGSSEPNGNAFKSR